ncbi:MAG TPA: transaldolase [Phycisphaerales bacterium]|nr:transaldolase [Phycisphaerales bacterium]HCD32115.1 transaldolase [Phycisphaerales bacterium]|tara:strand:- start:5 stop:1063 length:1059 start_codon:yes stop_codon:yes gene_type:complete
MSTAMQSIIDAGTTLWLDSIDPDLVAKCPQQGITGATSNPLIVADLIKSGRFDDLLAAYMKQDMSDEQVAWATTNQMVTDAQEVFLPVWEQTNGNNGYVSFELDPVLEDAQLGPSHDERVARYIMLGRKWGVENGGKNRMIKVPATPAGLDALEDLAAMGLTLNVTLIFTERQYTAARDAIWRGAQKRGALDTFKSVYSIFVSRVDVYTQEHHPNLSDAAQGMVGLVNAKRIWAMNKGFWKSKNLPLKQELIFASTAVKKPDMAKDFYISQLTGSDIQTNPPSLNETINTLGKTYTNNIASLPAENVLDEIDQIVDMIQLENILMQEGLAKFADPQKALIKLIGEKREALLG